VGVISVCFASPPAGARLGRGCDEALIKTQVKALTNWWIDSKSIINTFKNTAEMLYEWVYQTVASVKYGVDSYMILTNTANKL